MKAPTMIWQGVGLTDIGRVRTTNQDAYLVNDELRLWIVADGMGSHKHSGLASQLAIEAIHTFLMGQVPSNTIADAHHWETLLRKAVIHANDGIRSKCRDRPELSGMGTTVVLAFIPNPLSNEMYIAHAGDSRAYLLRGNTLTLLTRDHTLLEERVRDGLLPKDTPASHKLGHVLTKVVGIDTGVEADCSHLTLQKHDSIILCSDGLNKMMNDEEIRAALLSSREDTNRDSCHTLIEKANGLGGHDNVTVVVVQTERLTRKNHAQVSKT